VIFKPFAVVPRAAEFLQVRESIVLGVTAGIDGKRARHAIGKPKGARLAGITAGASPANLRGCRPCETK
jgi:hypothetical protein